MRRQGAGSIISTGSVAGIRAGDESTFINGHDLVIDGGLSGGRLWSVQQEGWKQMREPFGRES
jgi:hypothetical protein